MGLAKESAVLFAQGSEEVKLSLHDLGLEIVF